MWWFVVFVVSGLLSLVFIINAIRFAWIDEMIIGAVLAIICYFSAVNAGLIQPVV